MRFKFFKKTEFGITTQLHLQENKGEFITGKVFPETNEIFERRDLIELTNEEWIKEGIDNNLLDISPNHSS